MLLQTEILPVTKPLRHWVLTKLKNKRKTLTVRDVTANVWRCNATGAQCDRLKYGVGVWVPRTVSVCERKADGLWVQSDRLQQASSLQTPASIPTKGYTVKPVLNGISTDQNIFPLKPGFRLIKVHYIQYKKLYQDMQTLTLRWLMSYIYIYGAPILDVSRSHTTTQHSR